MSELEFIVPGMSCSHCEHAIKTEVGKVDGVESVDVDLVTNVVVVHGDQIDRDTVVAAIDEAGYEVA
ncbi:MAG: heavy-metal-associated domain-containing protein [Actinobacteria bacterium]|nr:heavy-metal-associated domain-containing protein [Actinomycetota bacterium]